MSIPRCSLRLAACAAAAAALLTCQESTPPDAPAARAALVAVAYVCGGNFDLANGNPSQITVHFEVAGTGEAGELVLPSRIQGGVASITRLTTVTTGAVRLSIEGAPSGEAENTATACPPHARGPEPQASLGEWSAPFAWPVVAAHLHLLPDGRVLSWGGVGEPQVWSPATGTFTEVPAPIDVFCAGHTFLPDGRLLVAGGDISEDHGLPGANLFDYASTSWIPLAPMARGRWYPTTTELPDGRAVVLAGRDENAEVASVPEIWNGQGWQPVATGDRELPYYPRTFVAPNGKIFYAGTLAQSTYFDPSTGAWADVAPSAYGDREYGSAVMYQPGKVLIVGGSNLPNGQPTATSETIDLNDAAPAWRYSSSMASARRQMNATLLPDGRVVATGGTSSPGFSDPAGAVRSAEAWDPVGGTWTTWAANAVTRVYHSTTILLPDATLLHAGSGDGDNLPRELSAEIFSPPYLFHGTRPIIDAAPATVAYGERFDVGTRDPGTIVAVSWVRLSSVTHAFDQNQRFASLAFARSPGGLTVAAPSSPNLAPPGHYMLFLLNADGVPSIARIMQVR